MTRKFTILIGLAGLAAAALVSAAVCDPSTGAEESRDRGAPDGRGSEPADARGSRGDGRLSPFRPLETLRLDASRPAVQFFDPRVGGGRQTTVRVGAPGIWPPVRVETDERGVLYLPDVGTETLRGGVVREFEVLARSNKGDGGHWGNVRSSRIPGGERPNLRRATLRATGELTVRAVGPEGGSVEGARVRVSRGVVGFVSLRRFTDAEGEAVFERVPPGELLVAGVHPKDGPATRRRVRLEPAGEVAVDLVVDRDELPEVPRPDVPPRDVTVRIEGLTESTWAEAALQWRVAGGDWRAATPARESSGTRRWSTSVAAGEVQLRVETGDGAVASERFVLEEDEAFAWRPRLRWNVDVYVVDEWGTPVEGALVQMWGGGELVESAASRGDEPVEVEASVNTSYEVLGVGARQGEGLAELEPEDRELVVRLGEPLFSHEVPSDRPTDSERIGKLLGAPIVADGSARLVDAVDPESAARRAGIQRGDALLSLFEHDGAWRAVVAREGSLHRYRLVAESP